MQRIFQQIGSCPLYNVHQLFLTVRLHIWFRLFNNKIFSLLLNVSQPIVTDINLIDSFMKLWNITSGI